MPKSSLARVGALSQIDFSLSPEDNVRLSNVLGPLDAHVRQLELRLGVAISNRGHIFRVSGRPEQLEPSMRLLQRLWVDAETEIFDEPRLAMWLNAHIGEARVAADADEAQEVQIRTRRGVIRGRGSNQVRYLHAIAAHDINFGIGPAGTGKTYLAVASAVEALESNRVQRILLVRPAVEAGEKLGFLPGDLTQKVDPYLRPLYDALYEMLGVERVAKLIERNVIEVAPLAFMRGRTLNDAFVLLDEAQNTTQEQMKMFLTRLGFGSTAVITGDLTQIDLPRKDLSGLRDAVDVLRDVEGVSFTLFEARDVVRHPLVQRIVKAYEHSDETRRLAREAAKARIASELSSRS